MTRKSRRTAPVRVLTGADQELLRSLGHVGTMSSVQAHRYCGVNPDRLQRLKKSGLVEVKTSVVQGKFVETVSLTRKGQEYAREHLGVDHLYTRNGRQVAHDLKLAEAYFSLHESVRATWRNGNQVDAELGGRNGAESVGSLVDAVVEQDGRLVAIEVVTDSYGQKEVAEKETYAHQVLGAAIRFL